MKKFIKDPKHSGKEKLSKKLGDSPINYWSDLFVVAMVVIWIASVVILTINAIAVSITTMVMTYYLGFSVIDNTLWSEDVILITAPLSAVSTVWMIKNSVQHAILNNKGKSCPVDFPHTMCTGTTSAAFVRSMVTSRYCNCPKGCFVTLRSARKS